MTSPPEAAEPDPEPHAARAPMTAAVVTIPKSRPGRTAFLTPLTADILNSLVEIPLCAAFRDSNKES
ncbi:hypothetical protein GCM10022223_13450 [Kineosporia mesophila]|uniref:Uncharacterized protein n=1 Tax=Kineosporia mesophila TaxID=566012 RepID=A0ABP6Z9C9_9ACTN